MTPVQIGLATLFLGDSLDLLESMEADHILSDPPYEDELHAGAKEQRITRTDGRTMHGDLGFAGINDTRAQIARLCVERSNG